MLEFGDKPKILLIDDDLDLREVYKEYLVDAGYKVLETSDASRGTRIAIDESPKAIILDLMVPDKMGLEVLKDLLEKRDGLQMPIIVLTMLDDEETKKEAKDLGADEYLIKKDVKPFELVNKIEDMIV